MIQDEEAFFRHDEASVPSELTSAIEANQPLKEALQTSGMPLRFQAMVLGLTALRQASPRRRRR